MYPAPFPLLVKYAEVVFPSCHIRAAVSLFTEPGQEVWRTDAQESGDPLFLIFIEKDAPFAVAAVPAHFAVKCRHEKRLK